MISLKPDPLPPVIAPPLASTMKLTKNDDLSTFSKLIRMSGGGMWGKKVLRAEFYFLADFPTTILYDHANNYGYITKSIPQILTIYNFNNSALLYRLLFYKITGRMFKRL